MERSQRLVLDWHKLFGVVSNPLPTIPGRSTCDLRIELIREETRELGIAFDHNDVVEAADALGDLLYVVHGAALACGIDPEPVFEEIHRSNMTKANPDGTVNRRADGKIIKAQTYSPARLKMVLEQQPPLFD